MQLRSTHTMLYDGVLPYCYDVVNYSSSRRGPGSRRIEIESKYSPVVYKLHYICFMRYFRLQEIKKRVYYVSDSYSADHQVLIVVNILSGIKIKIDYKGQKTSESQEKEMVALWNVDPSIIHNALK